MNYKITNGSISFGADTILENINIEIKDKEKIAIVGRNGCGKTTLLKAITGELELEEGTGENKFLISKIGNPTIGYLKQVAFEDNSISLIDEILKSYKKIIDTEIKLNNLLQQIEHSPSEKIVSEYSDTQELFKNLGGYSYKKEYLALLNNFGFNESDFNKPLSDFSGGQRTKIAFIKLLINKPDILLLDEPTNHLDLTSIIWLENYLKDYPSALVIVSHDRMFLNRIVNKVYEIEYGETKCYHGNYSDFEVQKKNNYLKQLKDHEGQKREIERITKLIERFRYKATKAKMVQSKIKMLEKMKIINPPNKYDLKSFHINFQPEYNSFKNVLEVKNLIIGYDKPLANISFNLIAGQKLGIIGTNGIGKSTLLKTLVENISKLGGRFAFGNNVKIGYFDQQMAEYSNTNTIYDEFKNEYPELNETQIRSALGSFMFSGEDVFKTINKLSGGEKVRLALCKILKSKPNVLILDEPTNHLDIVGKETLENLLKEYKGTILFVSHDRYFVNKLADSLLVFEDNNVKYINSNYEEYENAINEKVTIATSKQESNKKVANPKPQSDNQSKFSPKKELDKIIRKINKIELEIDSLNEQYTNLEKTLDNPDIHSDYIKITEIQNELDNIKNQITPKENEWLELQTLLEQKQKDTL